jgi:erythronate-4-phosphate dehydrogenase
MKILADENIPYVREVFGGLGEIRCAAGRAISADMLKGVDSLLVRSVTRVDEALLAGTDVRFVGTATIGFDHVDVDYLNHAGIAFTSAAGSNSNSVVEYVLTAILTLAERYGWELAGKTLGIVGVGNIGSRLGKKAKALGLTVLPNDPPVQRRTGDSRFVSLAEALQADIITFHVPLTKSGPDATYHLLNAETLKMIRPDALLINSSRGAVVDNLALKQCLTEGSIGPVVLDVWEGEPNIDVELLDAVAIGTPHIAGYSLDGKVNGTIMLYEALKAFTSQNCRVGNLLPTPSLVGQAMPDIVQSVTEKDTLAPETKHFTAEHLLPAPPVARMTLETDGKTDQNVLMRAMMNIYDIRRDDHTLRGIAFELLHRRREHFDRLRKEYPTRRESHNTLVSLKPYRKELAEKLAMIGFRIV